MLSFIRKRLPSRDRNNEHLQNIKSNQIQRGNQDNDDDDDEMKRAQSTNELNMNNNENKKKKKNKKKNKSSLTLNELVHDSNTSSTIHQINQSYSDVDYFPMMPGALSRTNNSEKISNNHDSLSDCYLNPSENVQTTVITPRVFEIPVIDCRNEQRIKSYKDVDHQRTKALREVTEQRTQEKSIK